MNDLYAVIIAGGSGTRLWPSSRQFYPKQIKPFIDNRTMLQVSYNRMRQFVELDNILICTGVKYQDYCLEQLPDLKPHQLILEPVPRNTAAAVGLSAVILAKRNPNATMVNLWSDSFIKNENEHKNQILLAVDLLKDLPDYLIIIPARPTYPAIGYGYLQAGDTLIQKNGIDVYKVDKFVEKPDIKVAEQYLQQGNFYWNTGIFVCKPKTLLSFYKQHMPKMYDGLLKIQSAWDTPDQDRIMQDIFPQLESMAIDYAIFEKVNRMALIPADLGWSDIGNWQSVYDLMKHKSNSNLAIKGNVITINSKDSLVFNEDSAKLVAVAGLNNVVVVNTQDAVLVIDKNSDQDVKKIVEEIKAKKMTQYL